MPGCCGRGVSVCLRSLVGFEWGGDWEEFCLAVGKALWGSKWYEVMPGEPWSDLEDRMETLGLSGDPEAVRKHWGSWSSKLETVLLVAVPSESGGRNAARILPGRDDVYIIPRADCIDGHDGSVYYSNQNIQACLVLKSPANGGDIAATVSHVQCKAEYDEKGMAQLRLSPISDSDVVVDIDEGEQWTPKITQFTMTIAQPASADVARFMHHSAQQPTFSSQQLWLEDVARFKPKEMAAGIAGVEQQLTQAGDHDRDRACHQHLGDATSGGRGHQIGLKAPEPPEKRQPIHQAWPGQPAATGKRSSAGHQDRHR